MTKSQQQALEWLAQHGGSGVRTGRGRVQVLAAGEIAPFMWVTFKALIAMGRIRERAFWRIELVVA